MSNNNRDTQFAGFAKMLTDELVRYLTSRSGLTLDEIEQNWQQITSRWAYDLVEHTVGYSLLYLHECGIDLSGSVGSRIAPSIPDVTKWPNGHEQSLYLIDDGGYCGAQALEILKKEQA